MCYPNATDCSVYFFEQRLVKSNSKQEESRMKKIRTIFKKSSALLLAAVMLISTNIVHVSAAEPAGAGKYNVPVLGLDSGIPPFLTPVKEAFSKSFGNNVTLEIKEDGTKEITVNLQHMVVNFGGVYHCNVLTVQGATVLSTRTEQSSQQFGNPSDIVEREVPAVIKVALPQANQEGKYPFIITVDFMNNMNGGNVKPLDVALNLDFANATEVIDYTALNEKIAEVKAYDEANYAAIGYAQLKTVIAEAEQLVNNASSSAEVKEMIAKLDQAKDSLVDISELVTLIAESKELKQDNYTEESYAKFATELQRIEKESKEIRTAEDAQKLLKQLEDAKKELKYVGGNYSKVEAALRKIPKTPSNYTEESWKKLMDAKNAVEYGLGEADQEKIDGFAKNIEDCIKALELKDADYTKVDEALKKVPEDMEKLYTEKSVKAVKDAVNAVVRDLKIDRQKDVDQMAADIEAAVKKLEKKSEKPQKPDGQQKPNGQQKPDSQQKPEEENGPLDKNNLKDGIYEVSVQLYHATNDQLSMAAKSLVSPAKIVVKNGVKTMYVYTQPMTFGNMTASLQEMRVFDLNGNYQNAAVQATNEGNPTCFSFQLPHTEEFIKVQVNPHVEMMGNQFLDARIRVNYQTLSRVSKDANDVKVNVLQPSSGNPKTGDSTNVAMYVIILGLSLLAAGTLVYKRKFYKEK